MDHCRRGNILAFEESPNTNGDKQESPSPYRPGPAQGFLLLKKGKKSSATLTYSDQLWVSVEHLSTILTATDAVQMKLNYTGIH